MWSICLEMMVARWLNFGKLKRKILEDNSKRRLKTQEDSERHQTQ
jgi:hypothetical protein